MTTYLADPKHIRRTIIIFSSVAVILIGLGLVLDTGLALRRRSSDITLEEALLLFGALSLIPVIFAFMRKSPDNCAFKISDREIHYANVAFGWPLIKRFTFAPADIGSVTADDDTLQVNFTPGHQYADADRDEDEYDLEIDCDIFAVPPQTIIAAIEQAKAG